VVDWYYGAILHLNLWFCFPDDEAAQQEDEERQVGVDGVWSRSGPVYERRTLSFNAFL
jgi:hypothetical protein